MMKHALRCHDFGSSMKQVMGWPRSLQLDGCALGKNRASPQGVAAKIVASFVARLANMANIGCTSLRAIDDFDSHRTRISSC
jgi:hypothetical protein